jgi:rare lipoprotein A
VLRNLGSRALPTASVLLISFGLGACAGRPAPVIAPDPGWSETGVASWYGEPFHGRQTASGEVYDMEEMTAAHQTLAFGTVVRVHNRDNGRSTEVRITDRGPFIGGRIIDLSRAAARELEMLGPGTARVRVTVIRAPAQSDAGRCVDLQVGAYRDAALAEDLERRVRDAGYPVRIEEGEDGLLRVLAGPFEGESLGAAAERRFGGFFRRCDVWR